MAVRSFTGEGSGAEVAAAVIFGFAFIITTFCLARRTPTRDEWRNLSGVMRAGYGVYVTSLINVGIYFIIVFAVGTERSAGACRATYDIICLTLATSKLLLYNFYIERLEKAAVLGASSPDPGCRDLCHCAHAAFW